jgi:hypothetical protein
MSRILVLMAILATSAFAQEEDDPEVDAGQQEPLPLEVEVQSLKALLTQIKKDKDEDTGLHAEAAAEDHGEEDTEEEFEDIDFTGPEEELVIIEESVPLEPPVPFLPQPEG